MTENVLQRMVSAVQENETFTNYLESLMKIHVEHTLSMIKNVNKYLEPMRTTYEALGSQKQHFIGALKELDVSHANIVTQST